MGNPKESLSFLLELPTELVGLIFSFTDKESALALRSSCRALNCIFLDTQAARFFAAVTTDLSKQSLEELRSVANNHDVAKCIRTMRFHAPSRPGAVLGRLGTGFTWPRLPPDHRLTIRNPAIAYFEQILIKQLHNCRSFIIYPNHEEEHCEEANQRRARPSYSIHWISTSDVMTILFRIVTRTGMPIRGFQLLSQNTDSLFLWKNGRDTVFREIITQLDPNRTSERDLRNARFKEAWSHIQHLTLRVKILPRFSDRQHTMIRRNESNVHLLLHSVVKLRTLNLMLEGSDTILHPRFIEVLSKGDRCTALTQLSLANMHVSGTSLLSLLLRCHGTLRHLQLKHVCIESGNNWEQLLKGFKDHALHLNTFHLSQLLNVIGIRHWPMIRVAFDALSEVQKLPGGEEIRLDFELSNTFRRTVGIYYSGQEMQKALGLIASSIVLF